MNTLGAFWPRGAWPTRHLHQLGLLAKYHTMRLDSTFLPNPRAPYLAVEDDSFRFALLDLPAPVISHSSPARTYAALGCVSGGDRNHWFGCPVSLLALRQKRKTHVSWHTGQKLLVNHVGLNAAQIQNRVCLSRIVWLVRASTRWEKPCGHLVCQFSSHEHAAPHGDSSTQFTRSPTSWCPTTPSKRLTIQPNEGRPRVV